MRSRSKNKRVQEIKTKKDPEFMAENGREEWGFIFTGLLEAYYRARKGKRDKEEVRKFEICLIDNLIILTDQIYNKTYKPSPGIAFIVHDPVMREVFAAPFRDRIVHHFLCSMNMPRLDKHFIRTSTSCRIGKGTHYAVRELHASMQRVSENFTKKDVYVAKFDLKGFFMSLDRRKVLKEVKRVLKLNYPARGTEYKISIFLWRVILMNNPLEGVRRKGGRKDWRELPRSKSLFCQKPGVGIVIGDLTSQLVSNIYMNKFDHYMVAGLGFREYGRYVDDFYVVLKYEEKERLKKTLPAIENYLRGMGLTLHPRKRSIQTMDKGARYLGAVVRPRRILLGERLKNNLRRALLANLMGEENEASIKSYMGHVKHVKHYKMMIRMRKEMLELCRKYSKNESTVCAKERCLGCGKPG